MTQQRINILIIGDEVLSRSVTETNLDYVLQAAAMAGYGVSEVSIVRDSIPAIVQAVQRLHCDNHFLITSGGIGPTHDDVTLEAVAQAFGAPLEEDPQMRSFLQRVYGERCSPAVLRMARLPRGMRAELDDGGSWPILHIGRCFVLPGLPRAFRQRIDRFFAALPPQPRSICAAVYTDADESRFSDCIAALQRRFPQVEVGSYPVIRAEAGYAARVTLRGLSRPVVQAAYSELTAAFEDAGWLKDRQAPHEASGAAGGGGA